MKFTWKGFFLFLFLGGIFGQISLAQSGDFLSLQKRLVELYQENRSAMVRVKAVYEAKTPGDIPQVIIGTGFFISREGLILTNASIATNPVRVWIEHENIAYAAEVVGNDQRSNLALLRINKLPKEFNYFHLVDSADMPEIGSFVVRISMPMELGPTPSLGLVGGFESRFNERFFPCLYIRTNIPAGPGDGGAAYMSLTGRLLGIQVGSLPDIGASYILPARAALRIRDDLLFSGEVNYGWIGFDVEEETSVSDGQKILISEVFDSGPAAKAGLLVGDQLVRIGDYDVGNLDELRTAMFYTRVDQLVEVIIERAGETKSVYVKLIKRPDNEPFQVLRPSISDPGNVVDGPLKKVETENDVIEED